MPRGDTLWLASDAYRDYAALQDTIALYGNRAQRIVAAIHPDSTSAQRQRQLMRDLDDCRQQMHEAIMRCAARNGDNALGQFIRENYLGLVPDSLPAPQQ